MNMEYLVRASTCQRNCTDHGIPPAAWVGIGIVAFSLVFLGPRLIAVIRNRGPKINGPALTGTARILSVRLTGAGGYALGWLGMALSESYVCWTALRVEVPGREPYDVTIRGYVPKRLYPDLEGGGRTVAVQVDSTNPKKARIDFNQPIT
jgi:hypothetical protein